MNRVLIVLIFPILLFAMPKVIVSIAPQKYFVSKIKGDDKDISIMIPKGASPATYSPKPTQLKELNGADIYFTIGVPFEKNWLDRFRSINKNLLFVDTTKGIKKVDSDPHVWLDPNLVKIIAKNIKEAFVKKDPQNSTIYEKNYQNFLDELNKLDESIKKITANIKQKNFIVYHPSFGYFARAYGLHQIALEHEGKKPSLKYEMSIIDFAKKNGIKTIFISPEFSQKEAKFIANRVNAKVKVIDHLSENWKSNLIKMAKSFEKNN